MWEVTFAMVWLASRVTSYHFALWYTSAKTPLVLPATIINKSKDYAIGSERWLVAQFNRSSKGSKQFIRCSEIVLLSAAASLEDTSVKGPHSQSGKRNLQSYLINKADLIVPNYSQNLSPKQRTGDVDLIRRPDNQELWQPINLQPLSTKPIS